MKTNTNIHTQTNLRADSRNGAGTARPRRHGKMGDLAGTSRPRPNTNANTNLNRNKRQFVEAVLLMAPGNKFIADVARRVPQDMLPAVAGVAAFELASTLELLCKSWRLRRPLESGRREQAESRNWTPKTDN